MASSNNNPAPLYLGEPVCLDGIRLNLPGLSADDDEGLDVLARIAALCRQVFGCRCKVKFWKEGKRNLLFLVQLSKSRPPYAPMTLLVRVANWATERSCISTKSEVDTMLYLHENDDIRIPVPRIYAYSSDQSLMYASFIIMEHITTGLSIYEVFDSLTPVEQARTIEDYARIVQELAHCQFTSIGSLEKAPDGSFHLAALSANRSDATERRQLPTAREFSQPFRSVVKWLQTLEIDKMILLENFPEVARGPDNTEEKAQELIERSLEVLQRMLPILPQVAAAESRWLPRLSALCLYHVDLHGGTILICPSGPDAGRIVSVIDWEEAGVFPIWRLVEAPEWLGYHYQGAQLHPRPPQEAARNTLLFHTAVTQRDPNGPLAAALDKKYDLLRSVAQAVSSPWWRHERREVCMKEYQDPGLE